MMLGAPNMMQNRPDTMACGIDANRPPNLPAQHPNTVVLQDAERVWPGAGWCTGEVGWCTGEVKTCCSTQIHELWPCSTSLMIQAIPQQSAQYVSRRRALCTQECLHCLPYKTFCTQAKAHR